MVQLSWTMDTPQASAFKAHGSVSSEDNWEVIDAYFREENLVRQQTELFNTFIEHDLAEIVKSHGTLTVKNDTKEITVVMGNTSIAKPQHQENSTYFVDLLPHSARIRNLNYAAKVMVDVTTTETNLVTGEVSTRSGIEPLCRMPIMVKSKFCHLYGMTPDELVGVKECPHDLGGYFIINGSEKVVIAQERMASNTVFVFKKDDTFVAEVLSVADNSATKTVSIKFKPKEKTMKLCGNFLRDDVPVSIILKALGVLSVDDFISLSPSLDRSLVASLWEESSFIHTQGEAVHFLIKTVSSAIQNYDDRLEKMHKILVKDLLPHAGNELAEKARFLAYMVLRMQQVASGARPVDDRDHYGKKRVDFTGSLMASLFKTLFKRLMSELTKHISKTITRSGSCNAHDFIRGKQNSMFISLRTALATGNWGDQKKTYTHTRQGVSQNLSRYNFAATLSNLRRINTPVGREGKLVKPRLLHSTQWGIACPAETPEGQACGLVKNLAFMATVSDKSGTAFIMEALLDNGLVEFCDVDNGDSGSPAGAGLVFVNGTLVGYHLGLSDLHRSLLALRRSTTIHPHVALVYDSDFNELCICTDYGRICRPILVVDEKTRGLRLTRKMVYDLKHRKMTWSQLLEMGVIDYVDAEESEHLRIAMYPSEVVGAHSYTHCEIHPAMILGVCASQIPFPDHNQAPRNCYQSAMSKQSIGTFLTSYMHRMETVSNVLYYPQKPLVVTKASKYLHNDHLPTGTNAIVAIACYGGYNQEDSTIMNQSAIDRGLFRSTNYHADTIMEKKAGETSKESIEKPDAARLRELFPHSKDPDLINSTVGQAYSGLDADGLVFPNTIVKGEDILVGKVLTEPVVKDQSMRSKAMDGGIVDRIVYSKGTEDNHPMVKVRVRTERIPQQGDKFASRHGQKGTVGITYRQEDMPFTADGVVPDIIINPHCIPSRMTIGHIIECVLGKSCTMAGEEGNATPFTQDFAISEITSELEKHGFKGDGTEELFCGMTGERLKARIFIGPTFYQRLKHMVDDKIHSRSSGPVQVLTRQPVEGRSRDGGLRVGEMENQCLVSHGSAAYLRDRLFENSDPYETFVCNNCGLIAVSEAPDMQRGKVLKTSTGTRQNWVFKCRVCIDSGGISRVSLPFAYKLLVQELMSMGIAPRIKV